MNYVFDSSFIGALIIPDEKDPQVDKLYDKIEENDEKYAPHLIWYEVANIFNNLILRKRFTFDEVLQFFSYITSFKLISDTEAGVSYSESLLRLCDDCHLSSYDAAYLELAERKKAVLCTMDEDMKKAAKKYGVAVLK